MRKKLSLLLSFLLVFQQAGYGQTALDLSGMVSGLRASIPLTEFRPAHLRYLSYDRLTDGFKLLLDKGDLKSAEAEAVPQAEKLMAYFRVGLSLPDDAFWVNLRPDSPERMLDDDLARTDVGRILLEADLQLKKDTAASTSPDTKEGKEYWERLYKKAEELYGSQENISIPTLTRPWIVPDEIIVRDSGSSAYIYKATLKVMLEQDYLKGEQTYEFKDSRQKALNEFSTQLIRELIIPKITREVNSAKKYAQLRQVYYSLILAQWFKKAAASGQLTYSGAIDSRNTAGLVSITSWDKNEYFRSYQKSFKEGEYNLQKHYSSLPGQDSIRSYFSGGIVLGKIFEISAALKGAAVLSITGFASAVPSRKNSVLLNMVKDGVMRVMPIEQKVLAQPDGNLLDTAIPKAPSLSLEEIRKTYAVHATDFAPAGGIIKAEASDASYDKRWNGKPPSFHPLIHFALGELVRGHIASWDTKKYAVIVPLGALEKQLVNVNPYDTFILGDLKLPPGSILLAPQGEKLPDMPVGVRIVEYGPQTTLRQAVDNAIKDNGGAPIRMIDEGVSNGDRAYREGKDINSPEQFAPLLEKMPSLSFGTHLFSEKGNAFRFGVVDSLLQLLNDPGHEYKYEEWQFFYSVLMQNVAILESDLQKSGMPQEAMAVFYQKKAELLEWVSRFGADLQARPHAIRGEERSIVAGVLASLPPDEMKALVRTDSLAIFRFLAPEELFSQYAVARLLKVNRKEEKRELFEMLESNLVRAANAPQEQDWFFRIIGPSLNEERSNRVPVALELMRLDVVRAFLASSYGMLLEKGQPQTLLDVCRAHPVARLIFEERAPPPAETDKSPRAFLYRIDSRFGQEKVNERMLKNFEEARLFGLRVIRQEEALPETLRWITEEPMSRTRPEATILGGTKLNYYEQLRQLNRHGVTNGDSAAAVMWKDAGRYDQFRAMFPTDEAFWTSEKSLYQIYLELSRPYGGGEMTEDDIRQAKNFILDDFQPGPERYTSLRKLGLYAFEARDLRAITAMLEVYVALSPEDKVLRGVALGFWRAYLERAGERTEKTLSPGLLVKLIEDADNGNTTAAAILRTYQRAHPIMSRISFQRIGKEPVNAGIRIVQEKQESGAKAVGGNKLALVIEPSADWNGAFETRDDIAELEAKGFEVRRFRIGNVRQLKELIESADRKISLMILGGHGARKLLQMGSINRDTAHTCLMIKGLVGGLQSTIWSLDWNRTLSDGDRQQVAAAKQIFGRLQTALGPLLAYNVEAAIINNQSALDSLLYLADQFAGSEQKASLQSDIDALQDQGLAKRMDEVLYWIEALSQLNAENTLLTVDNVGKLGKIQEQFADDAQVVLKSCSTGKGRNAGRQVALQDLEGLVDDPQGLFNDLVSRGYMSKGGMLQEKWTALDWSNELELSPIFEGQRNRIFERISEFDGNNLANALGRYLGIEVFAPPETADGNSVALKFNEAGRVNDVTYVNSSLGAPESEWTAEQRIAYLKQGNVNSGKAVNLEELFGSLFGREAPKFEMVMMAHARKSFYQRPGSRTPRVSIPEAVKVRDVKDLTMAVQEDFLNALETDIIQNSGLDIRNWHVCGPASFSLAQIISRNTGLPLGRGLEGNHIEVRADLRVAQDGADIQDHAYVLVFTGSEVTFIDPTYNMQFRTEEEGRFPYFEVRDLEKSSFEDVLRDYYDIVPFDPKAAELAPAFIMSEDIAQAHATVVDALNSNRAFEDMRYGELMRKLVLGFLDENGKRKLAEDMAGADARQAREAGSGTGDLTGTVEAWRPGRYGESAIKAHNYPEAQMYFVARNKADTRLVIAVESGEVWARVYENSGLSLRKMTIEEFDAFVDEWRSAKSADKDLEAAYQSVFIRNGKDTAPEIRTKLDGGNAEAQIARFAAAKLPFGENILNGDDLVSFYVVRNRSLDTLLGKEGTGHAIEMLKAVAGKIDVKVTELGSLYSGDARDFAGLSLGLARWRNTDVRVFEQMLTGLKLPENAKEAREILKEEFFPNFNAPDQGAAQVITACRRQAVAAAFLVKENLKQNYPGLGAEAAEKLYKKLLVQAIVGTRINDDLMQWESVRSPFSIRWDFVKSVFARYPKDPGRSWLLIKMMLSREAHLIAQNTVAPGVRMIELNKRIADAAGIAVLVHSGLKTEEQLAIAREWTGMTYVIEWRADGSAYTQFEDAGINDWQYVLSSFAHSRILFDAQTLYAAAIQASAGSGWQTDAALLRQVSRVYGRLIARSPDFKSTERAAVKAAQENAWKDGKGEKPWSAELDNIKSMLSGIGGNKAIERIGDIITEPGRVVVKDKDGKELARIHYVREQQADPKRGILAHPLFMLAGINRDLDKTRDTYTTEMYTALANIAARAQAGVTDQAALKAQHDPLVLRKVVFAVGDEVFDLDRDGLVSMITMSSREKVPDGKKPWPAHMNDVRAVLSGRILKGVHVSGTIADMHRVREAWRTERAARDQGLNLYLESREEQRLPADHTDGGLDFTRRVVGEIANNSPFMPSVLGKLVVRKEIKLPGIGPIEVYEVPEAILKEYGMTEGTENLGAKFMHHRDFSAIVISDRAYKEAQEGNIYALHEIMHEYRHSRFAELHPEMASEIREQMDDAAWAQTRRQDMLDELQAYLLTDLRYTEELMDLQPGEPHGLAALRVWSFLVKAYTEAGETELRKEIGELAYVLYYYLNTHPKNEFMDLLTGQLQSADFKTPAQLKLLLEKQLDIPSMQEQLRQRFGGKIPSLAELYLAERLEQDKRSANRFWAQVPAQQQQARRAEMEQRVQAAANGSGKFSIRVGSITENVVQETCAYSVMIAKLGSASLFMRKGQEVECSLTPQAEAIKELSPDDGGASTALQKQLTAIQSLIDRDHLRTQDVDKRLALTAKIAGLVPGKYSAAVYPCSGWDFLTIMDLSEKLGIRKFVTIDTLDVFKMQMQNRITRSGRVYLESSPEDKVRSAIKTLSEPHHFFEWRGDMDTYLTALALFGADEVVSVEKISSQETKVIYRKQGVTYEHTHLVRTLGSADDSIARDVGERLKADGPLFILSKAGLEVSKSDSGERMINAANRFISVMIKQKAAPADSMVLFDSPFDLPRKELKQVVGPEAFSREEQKSWGYGWIEAHAVRLDGGLPDTKTPAQPANDQANKGGIDFRSLPIISQQAAANLKLTSGMVIRPGVDSAKEWQAIEKMVAGGMKPSCERLREFVGICYGKGELGEYSENILGCVAEILQMEEAKAQATEPVLKDILIFLETARTEKGTIKTI